MAKFYMFKELSKTIGHHFAVFLISFLCLFSLLFAIFFSLIIHQPRSFPFLTSYINQSLQEQFSGVNLHLDEAFFVWDNENYNIDIRTSNLTLENDKGKLIASFPNLDINFSLLALIQGKFLPKEVILNAPTFRIYMDSTAQKQELAEEGVKKGESKLAIDALIRYFDTLSKSHNHFPLQTLTIKNAQIFIDRGDEEFLWCIDQFQSHIQSTDLELTIRNTFTLDLAGEPLPFRLNFIFPTFGTPIADLSFDDTPSYALIHCLPKHVIQPWMQTKNSQFSVSGTFEGEFDTNGILQTLELEIKEAKGHIFDKDYLQYPLRFNDAHLKGSISNAFTLTHLEEATVVFTDGMTLESSGFLKHQAGSSEADLNLAIRGFQFEFFDTYWPVNVAPTARQWLNTHLPTGRIKEGYARLKIRPEYFQKEATIPDDAVNATIYFDRLGVEYHPDFPRVHSVAGTARIRKNELVIGVDDGQIGYSSMQDTSLKILNLFTPQRRLTVQGSVHGPVLDVFNFIPKNATPEDWFNYSQATGSATTTVDISIPLHGQVRYQDMHFNIHSNLQDVSMPVIYNFVPLTRGELKASFTGSTMRIEGNALLAESPSSMLFEAQIAPKQFDYSLQAKSQIQPGTFSAIGIEDVLTIQKGAVNINVGAKKIAQKSLFNVGMNFSPSSLHSRTFNFSKPLNEPMQINLTSTLDAQGNITISPLKLEGKQVGGTVTASFKKGLSSLQELKAQQFHFGQFNLFDASYTIDHNQGFTASISGNSLDLRPINLQQSAHGESGRFLKSLNINVNKLYMKENVEFSKFRGNLECTQNSCTSAHFKAIIGKEAPFEATLTPVSDIKRNLVVITSDAGNVLRGVGLYSKLGGGKLYLDSDILLIRTDNGDIFNKINGTLEMKNFVALKTPAVANIITLSSLPGLLGILEKDTIPFDLLEGRFNAYQGVFQLNDLKATGPAMGVTSDGTINLAKNTIDLKGTIVPAVLGVNRLLGKVPVLGDLVGGDAEGGIIGVNYRVTGPADNPEASVNALSAFAPGFLRKLFQ